MSKGERYDHTESNKLSYQWGAKSYESSRKYRYTIIYPDLEALRELYSNCCSAAVASYIRRIKLLLYY